MQTQHDISTNIYERFIQLPEAGIYEETLDRIRINFLPEKYWGISNTILGTMLHRHGWRKDYFDADYWYSPTCLRLERDDFIEISGMVYRRYECDLNQETDAMINKIEQPGSVPTRRRFPASARIAVARCVVASPCSRTRRRRPHPSSR